MRSGLSGLNLSVFLVVSCEIAIWELKVEVPLELGW